MKMKETIKKYSKKIFTFFKILVVLIAIIGFVYFMKDRYPHKYTVDFNYNNAFIARLVSDNPEINNKPVVGFWQLTFVKHGNIPSTPKQIEIFLKIGKKWHPGRIYNVMTGKAKKKDGIFNNVLWTELYTTRLNIFDWYNLGLILDQETLNQGEVVKGSALFIFDLPNNEIIEAEKFKIDIVDYSDKKFKTKAYIIEKKWINSYRKGYKVIDRSF